MYHFLLKNKILLVEYTVYSKVRLLWTRRADEVS